MYFTREKDERKIKIERIYSEHRNRLFWTAYKILNDKMLSEDAVHETIIRAIGHLHKIEETNSYKTAMFLVIICRNIAIDIYRKNKRICSREFTTEDSEFYWRKNEDNPLDMYITNESLRQLINTIKQLDKMYSDILMLKYISECSNEEISQLLNLPNATVRKRAERGRTMLIQIIEKDGMR